MMTAVVPLRALLLGRAKPLGPRGFPSAIDKHAVVGPVRLTTDGLAGDEQGDRKHHGGPEKALHHYPLEHYRAWWRDCPQLARTLSAPGAFGENLSTIGVTEAEVCLGDRFSLGGAVIQISQGRQPCWKLNIRFGLADMARRVQVSGRTGWYYRVEEAGCLAVGDVLTLLERPHPDWPLCRVIDLLYQKTFDLRALAELAEMDCLASSWRALCRRRLTSGEVESWSRRLETPSD